MIIKQTWRFALFFLIIILAYPLLLNGPDGFVGPGQVPTGQDHMSSVQGQRPGGFKAWDRRMERKKDESEQRFKDLPSLR